MIEQAASRDDPVMLGRPRPGDPVLPWQLPRARRRPQGAKEGANTGKQLFTAAGDCSDFHAARLSPTAPARCAAAGWIH